MGIFGHGPRPRRVVVGVAGHAGSAGTLAWAIAESAATGAQLVVVHATGRGGPRQPRGSLSALEAVDRAAAAAVAAARARLGEDCARVLVEAGTPGDVLLREAGPRDVLIIGGPPRSGWWVRSGTINHVVPRARCPVVVVHEPYGLEEMASPAGEPFRGHVVVGFGARGDSSDGPLGFAFGFAASHGLPLVVARAVPFLGFIDDETFADVVEPWQRKYPEVPARRAVLAGHPADALRAACSQAALLVIGAGGTALHPLGVTCRSLVATAGSPVAVLH